MKDEHLITSKSKKDEKDKAKLSLASLAGKDISKLSKAETDKLITIICQLLGIVDINGMIK
jgi:hypothetical protein